MNVKAALREALDLIGGLETILRRGDQIVLKPNILMPMDYKSGAVTNPFVIEALIDILREIGIRKIIIGEGAVVGESTDKCFKKSGVKKLAEKKKVVLLDLKKDDFIPMSVTNGKVFRILKIPKTIAESDAVINIPVLKTHDCFPVSLGLKNMKGVIHEKDKQRFHLLDLAQCIVDLNKLVLPRLTIIDGTVGMEGMGPVYGIPANMGLIFASFDTVAVDSVASQVIGIEPFLTEYIKLASEQGLGCADISNIEVLGKSVKEVSRMFKRVVLEEVLKSKEFEKYGIKILDGGACSGCRSVITALISDAGETGKLSKFSDTTFVMGQNIDLKELMKIKGNIVYFGVCTKKIRTDRGCYMLGCPPHILDVKKALGYKKEDFDNFSFLSTHLKHFGW